MLRRHSVREVEIIDEYEIRGYECWSMIQPDPPLAVGDIVTNAGRVNRIIAIERFMLANDLGLKPGKPIGLLLSSV